MGQACSGVVDVQAFPALIQEKINARGWNFHAINAGLRGLPVNGAKQIFRPLSIARRANIQE